jgi:phosphoribosylamine--glycine ligase
MKILVLGKDGRTHAFVWKLFNSPQASTVVCVPGNGGTTQIAPSADLDLDHRVEVARWAFEEGFDLILPASSGEMDNSLVDEASALRVAVCAPSHHALRLERSRCAAKEFLLRHQLPTAPGKTFTNRTMAERYLAAQPLPVVIKADNPTIASGIYHDRYTALNALQELFTPASLEEKNGGVVIEGFLPGPSLAISGLTDGKTVQMFLPTRIYNYFGEDDTGIYAPGMGAHTSNSVYAKKLTEYARHHLFKPLIAALAKEYSYRGIIGIDCIITKQGPRIHALRCAMHDMEAQVVFPCLESDLLPALRAATTQQLDQAPPLQWRDQSCVGIAVVAQGYPHHFPMGGKVEGLTAVETGVLVFHHETHNPLGMQYSPSSRGSDPLAGLIMGKGAQRTISTTGGHVLTVVALAATLNGARGKALVNAERISFPSRTFRGDIGKREFF